jgi:hypothetical protein
LHNSGIQRENPCQLSAAYNAFFDLTRMFLRMAKMMLEPAAKDQQYDSAPCSPIFQLQLTLPLYE